MQIHNIDSSFVWFQRLLDIITPIIILYVITSLYGTDWNTEYLTTGIIGGLSIVIFNQWAGVYSSWRGQSLFVDTKKIIRSWLITWSILVVLAFSLKMSSNFSRVIIFSWFIILPIILLAYRYFTRSLISKIRSHDGNKRRVAIIGAGNLGLRITNLLINTETLGYKPIVFYDDNSNLKGKYLYNLPVAGTIDTLLSKENIEEEYDEIFIALPLRAEVKIREILNSLANSSITVKFIPDFFSFDLLHSRITEIGGIPIVSVYDSPLNNLSSSILKRLEDIIISSLIIVLISPLLLLISVAIKISSKGNILFKQKRYGINGEEITIFKFRSMSVSEDDYAVKQASRKDPRITKIGNFLRKTSLDELPQFFNVMRGEMSIVGPRPHAVIHNEEYRKLIPKYMLRHLVKPGITGWAQVHGWRGETDTLNKMEKRVEFDLHYIDNWSLWLDLKIISLTILKGFINKNAY